MAWEFTYWSKERNWIILDHNQHKNRQNTLKFIDLDWNRSRKFGMPECFVGDFTELFTPYIGKYIVLRYYKTVTNNHPSDEEICLVELKVKSKK